MENQHWSKCIITDTERIEFKLHDLLNHYTVLQIIHNVHVGT